MCTDNQPHDAGVSLPADLAAWRQAMREKLITRQLRVDRITRRQWSYRINEQLLQGFPILQWMVVGCLLPRSRAICAGRILRKLRHRGATTLFAPAGSAALQFLPWPPGKRCAQGASAGEAASATQPQALLIPAIGFDEQGHCLVESTSAMDGALAQMSPQPLKIGMAHELGRIWTTHPLPGDAAMDFIITEQHIYHRAGGRLVPITDIHDVVRLAGQVILERSAPEEPHEWASPVCYAHAPELRFSGF